MPSTVEQLSPTRVKITVEVPFADLKPSMDKAYAEVAKSVNIPGFRRGKVPPVVIDQRFGRGVIIQEAFNESWQRFYGAAVTENKLSPLAQPDVEVTKLEDGDVLTHLLHTYAYDDKCHDTCCHPWRIGICRGRAGTAAA